MEIVLKDLPKHSLNEIYSGKHWTKRKKDKDIYKLLIKNQFKDVLSDDKQYSVSYLFEFRIKPLDTSNTVYMLKMIEDIIFEDDNFKIIPEIKIKSVKGTEDKITIKINELCITTQTDTVTQI